MLSSANPRSSSFFKVFEQRLRDLGYIEGQNIAFEYGNAGGAVDRLPVIAVELVRLDIDVIVTSTDVATRAAKNATTQIPILMVAINYAEAAIDICRCLLVAGQSVGYSCKDIDFGEQAWTDESFSLALPSQHCRASWGRKSLQRPLASGG